MSLGLGLVAVVALAWLMVQLPGFFRGEAGSASIGRPWPALSGVALAADDPIEILKNDLGMYFRHIPAGSFLMGAGPGFAGEPHYETPAHQVSVTRAFRLGVHEVTKLQWREVMGADPAGRDSPMSPVANVSFEDVQVFLERLGRLDGRSYRLPTEAEWEYAARAGTTTAYWFGGDPAKIPDYAWCGGDVAKSKTRPVGGKPPNPWGLHDMYGNVSEWVSDWFGEGYYTAKAVRDPKGPASGSTRVVRGGSHASDAIACQSAWRDSDLPMVRSNYIGFRAAWDE